MKKLPPALDKQTKVCYIVSMEEKLTLEVEALFAAHIARLETFVAGRDSGNPWHQSLNKVDSKNIASLREGRVPIYGDHMEMDNDATMFEFDDLVKELAPYPAT